MVLNLIKCKRRTSRITLKPIFVRDRILTQNKYKKLLQVLGLEMSRVIYDYLVVVSCLELIFRTSGIDIFLFKINSNILLPSFFFYFRRDHLDL